MESSVAYRNIEAQGAAPDSKVGAHAVEPEEGLELGSPRVAIKLLVSNSAAGSIIGAVARPSTAQSALAC
jgi:hypothetical protein